MNEKQELKRVLGMAAVFAVAVGLVCASSTMVSLINGFGTAGPAFIISLVVAFGVNLLVVLSFSELATMCPKAGQIYEYTKDAFTKGKNVLSTGIGTAYWGMMGFVVTAEVSAGAWALQYATGIGSLWEWVLILVVACAVINLLGVKLVAGVEFALVLFMIAVRVGIGFLCGAGVTDAGAFHTEQILNFAPFGWASVAAAIPLAFWNFVGLEFAVPLVEETKKPERNLPWGMILGAIVILVVSVIFGLGIIGVIDPVTQAGVLTGDKPQIALGLTLMGRIGLLIMGVASFTASFGFLNVAFASIPRIAFAMARDGLWPKIFAYIHPKFKTPWAAIGITFLLFIIGPLFLHNVVLMIYAASFIWLLVYLWVHFVVLKLKIQQPQLNRPFKVPAVVPIVGGVLIIWVLYASFKDMPVAVICGLGFVAVCFLYALIWTRIKDRKLKSKINDDNEICNDNVS